MRLDVRNDLDRSQRVAVQHDAGHAAVPDTAELDQCRLGRLPAGLLTVISPACACRLPAVGALIAACSVATGVGAAAPAPAPSDTGAMRGPTVTRLVQTFSELEGRLDTAARGHAAAALGRLLPADFELRNAARPGTPLPRAEFVQQMLDRPMAPARTE